jgi:GTP pyrophosphokinase
LSFSQVLDVYGFRIVVDNFANCYVALGTLHSMFKPMPGKFKDYIAIPKLNGYQSLHTTVIGPYGTPVEFQIRTEEMHRVAESGVAAHWLYKNEDGELTDLQQRTHAWLQSLLDIQHQTGDSAEFLEHVKVDLFPDSVYVFTPKSTIIALPRGATALDFAYTIHTDIGDHAVSARINHEPATLKTELRNGDIVGIDVSDDARPTPNWLTFVRTGKARSAIRHHLRTIDREEAIELGRMLLEQSLAALELPTTIPTDIGERLIHDTNAKSVSDLFAEIGVGKRMAMLVARHIHGLIQGKTDATSLPENQSSTKIKPVNITGHEPASSVQLAPCCLPIPGDALTGHLRRDQTLSVHAAECEVAKRLRSKEPGRWIDVSWANEHARRFDSRIRVLLRDEKGALARLAAEINESDSNIVHVGMDEGSNSPMIELRFTVQVEDRVHLARLMRNVKRVKGVERILRERS